jgi:regulatory protein
MLARREHSRRELERKLSALVDDHDQIPPLLDDFERRGWLSEERFAAELVAARRRRFGAQRIAAELREKGVSEQTIAEALTALDANELEAARTVWQKKFGAAPADARDRARQIRFLQGRGFSFEVIRRILAADDE